MDHGRTRQGTRASVLDPKASRDDEGKSRRRLARREILVGRLVHAPRLASGRREQRQLRHSDQVEAEAPRRRVRRGLRAAAVRAAGRVVIDRRFPRLVRLLGLGAAAPAAATRRRGRLAEAVGENALLAAAQRHPRGQGADKQAMRGVRGEHGSPMVACLSRQGKRDPPAEPPELPRRLSPTRLRGPAGAGFSPVCANADQIAGLARRRGEIVGPAESHPPRRRRGPRDEADAATGPVGNSACGVAAASRRARGAGRARCIPTRRLVCPLLGSSRAQGG